MIMALAAIVIYGTGSYFIIPFGFYGGLWSLLYWVITFMVGSFLLSTLLVFRCPRCAAYGDAKHIARKYKTKTKKEVATYPDGHKEVLSCSVERITVDTYRCNECGCTWKHTIFAHVIPALWRILGDDLTDSAYADIVETTIACQILIQDIKVLVKGLH